jgi:hypothetical protein
MSVEDRLRAGLAQEAEQLDPAVEFGLVRVLEAAAGRRRRRRSALAVAAVGAAAALALVTAWVLGSAPPRPPAVDPATEQAASALVGTWTLDVAGGDAQALGLDGRWRATVSAADSLMLVREGGAMSTATARVRGNLLETDALPDFPGCRDGIGTGLYQWRAEGGTVSVRVVGGDCEARRILFAESSWSPAP